MSHEDMPQEQSLALPTERSYLYKFVAQVIKSTWHVSVTQQVITGGTVALITVLVQIYNGLITTDLSWAYLRAALEILLITYGLIIFINILRAPFILDRGQREKIMRLSQRIGHMEGRHSPLVSEVAKKFPEVESPNLVCKLGRIVSVTKNKDGTLTLGGTDGDAAVAIFRNEAGDSVTDITDVRAHIYFYDNSQRNNPRYQVNTGVWIGTDDETIDFRVGATERLVVAITVHEEEGVFLLLEHSYARDSYNAWYFQPVAEALADDEYQVEVQLVGGKSKKKLGSFAFTLTLRPVFSLRLIEP